MPNVSRLFKIIFFLTVAAMLVLTVFALLNQPPGPLTDAQIEETVVAEVNLRRTQTATVAPSTALPDIEATVAARLESTPSPTADPNLIPVSDLETSGGVVSFIGGIINGIFGLLRGIWNLFSFGGIGLQLCCCLLMPIGALVALARESI